MEMESAVPLPEQTYYNVIRPVDDLWLWWTLANVIGPIFIILEVPFKFVGAEASFLTELTGHCNFSVFSGLSGANYLGC